MAYRASCCRAALVVGPLLLAVPAGCLQGASAGDASSDLGASDVSTAPDAAVDAASGLAVELCGQGAGALSLPATDSRVAALPNGHGATLCVTFGADPGDAISQEFADASGLRGRTVYVRAGAMGGTGAIDRPFGTLDEALRTAADATNFILARGTHAIDATIGIDRNVRLVGSGPAGGTQGTELRLAAMANPGFRVTTSSGQLVVSDVRFGAASGAGPVGIEVGPTSRAEVAHAVFSSLSTAVNVLDGAVLEMDRVNVVSMSADGLVVAGSATLRSTFVQGSALHGIVVRGRLVTNEVLLRGNSQGGVRLDGSSTLGADQLTRLAADRNNGYGIRVDGGGRTTQVAGSSLVANGDPSDSRVGYGAFATNGASLTFDPGLAAPGNRGNGTIVALNRVAGILATGTVGTIAVNGANVLRNAGPGMIVESGAGRIVVNETYFGFNVAIGLGLWGAFASSSTVQIQCDMFEGTIAGNASFGGDIVNAGDGLFAMSDMPWSAPMPVHDSVFAGNRRFGACLWSTNMGFERVTFRGNTYGVGRYGTMAMAPAARDIEITSDNPGANPPEASIRSAMGTERMTEPQF